MKNGIAARLSVLLAPLVLGAAVFAGNLGGMPGQQPAQPPAQQVNPPAQNSAFVGTWNCDYANDLPGVPTDTWMYSFAMAVYPNGQYEAQGNYWANSAGYWDPFYSSGTWSGDAGNFQASGELSFQSGWGMPFWMGAALTVDGVMTYRNSTQGGNLVIYCERAG